MSLSERSHTHARSHTHNSPPSRNASATASRVGSDSALAASAAGTSSSAGQAGAAQFLRAREVQAQQLARVLTHEYHSNGRRNVRFGSRPHPSVRDRTVANAGGRGPTVNGMRIRLVLLAISMLLLIPAVAHASLADEQRQGQDLVAQLQAKTKTCRDLSAEDFDHIGEYVMGRALGSIAAHRAMNDRMTAMMGSQAEGRIHQLLGARYVNCTAPAGAGNTNNYGYGGMGPGIMGGSNYGNGGMGPDDGLRRLELDDGRRLAKPEPPRLATPPTATARHQRQQHAQRPERVDDRRDRARRHPARGRDRTSRRPPPPVQAATRHGVAVLTGQSRAVRARIRPRDPHFDRPSSGEGPGAVHGFTNSEPFRGVCLPVAGRPLGARVRRW